MDAQGKTIDPRVGAIGVSGTPVRLNQSEAALAGYQVDDETIARVASLAANDLEIHDDIHAPGAYRRALLKTLVERALRRAAELKEHA
jgi:carbon-monoxide dehydrogenase medium subunit